MFHILPVGDTDEALNSGSGYKDSQVYGDSEPVAVDSEDPHHKVLDDSFADEEAEEVTEGHTTESIDEINGEETDEGLTASEEFTPATGPTSFETDPDPESTTYCSEPHSPDSALIQYALVIDAGSTGSRIHVYKFNNCGPTPALEYETFKAVQPGLSYFARDPTAAAASLDPLMEEAVRVVPKSLHHCSAVEVKATAGLRLLPGNEGQAILEEVRVRLESDWPFALSKEENAVEIMDGKDEGEFWSKLDDPFLSLINSTSQVSTLGSLPITFWARLDQAPRLTPILQSLSWTSAELPLRSSSSPCSRKIRLFRWPRATTNTTCLLAGAISNSTSIRI